MVVSRDGIGGHHLHGLVGSDLLEPSHARAGNWRD
jgi:hypothetical protein